MAREILRGAILGGLKGLAERFGLPGDKIEPIANELTDKVADDPVMKNEMNMEHPSQSRVVRGSAGGALVSLGTLINQVLPLDATLAAIADGTFDWAMFGANAGVLYAFSYVLYGRLANGLKPLKMWGIFRGRA